MRRGRVRGETNKLQDCGKLTEYLLYTMFHGLALIATAIAFMFTPNIVLLQSIAQALGVTLMQYIFGIKVTRKFSKHLNLLLSYDMVIRWKEKMKR